MKIETVTNKNIIFDNGDVISYVPEDESNYGEYSYPDFMRLEDEAFGVTFDLPLIFKKISGCGFTFGNPGKMFFVPCYSVSVLGRTSDVVIRYATQREIIKFDGFRISDEEWKTLHPETKEHENALRESMVNGVRELTRKENELWLTAWQKLTSEERRVLGLF